MKLPSEDDPITSPDYDEDEFQNYNKLYDTFEDFIKEEFVSEYCDACGGDWYDHVESDGYDNHFGYTCLAWEDRDYVVRAREKGKRCNLHYDVSGFLNDRFAKVCNHFMADHSVDGCFYCECNIKPTEKQLYRRFLKGQRDTHFIGDIDPVDSLQLDRFNYLKKLHLKPIEIQVIDRKWRRYK